MSNSLQIVTQRHIPAAGAAPMDRNRIDYSEFQQLDFRVNNFGYAIKYVLEGTENYEINGISYAVQAGESLLLSPGAQGKVRIDSKSSVRGICACLSLELINEILNGQNGLLPEESSAAPALVENVFLGKQAGIGRFMTQFGHKIRRGEANSSLSQQTFYHSLGELYLGEYRQFSTQLSTIKAAKSSTRHEIYKRLQKAKSFMEDCFTEPVEVSEIARQACLSEYQFFRLFKSVFGQSPYQYMLQKRLELGAELLRSGKFPVSEIALNTGFADIFSFSKAFKKQFGVPPSQILGIEK